MPVAAVSGKPGKDPVSPPLPSGLHPPVEIRFGGSTDEPVSDESFRILARLSLPVLGRIVTDSGEMRSVHPSISLDCR